MMNMVRLKSKADKARGKFIIILGLLFLATNLQGHDVSESLAVKMANDYYQRVKAGKLDISSMSLSSGELRVPERISPLGKTHMWLVPVEDGWMILSSNTKATPILAYIPSLTKPVYDSMPPAAQEMLNTYEDYIAYIEEHDTEYEEDLRWQECERRDDLSSNRNVASPITDVWLTMDVIWNQLGGSSDCNRCYNKFCPPINVPNNQCDKAAVGCVAVAIAQIMWYWKWPFAANVPTTVGGSTTDFKFYDWSKMPTFLNSATFMDQVDMTAGFLRDCGYALDMDYGISSSASDDDALNALNIFGYNANTMELRHKWNTSGWTNMLRSNIDSGCPVYYSGHSSAVGGNGHAFVVYGYQTGGPLYYINWGWGGEHNGLYNIDDAYVNDTLHYEHFQSAIFGIKPSLICGDLILSGPIFYNLHHKFCYAVGGILTLSNITLQNVEKGELYSASVIQLLPGTTIEQGCDVYFAIRDVPCPQASLELLNIQSDLDGNDSTIRAPQKREVLNEVPPACKILSNGQILIERNGKTYTITGQQIK